MLRLHLHSELAAAHSSHGVSHEDYNQYSSYCTRKLSRLRHGKVVRRDLLHTRLYKNSLSTRIVVDGENGGGASKAKHAYRAIDITNLPPDTLASHPNYFLEPLYCAERCWAVSMAIRAEQHRGDDGIGGGSGNTTKRLSRGKTRANSIKKLRKAVNYVELLEMLMKGTKVGGGSPNENGTDNGEEQTNPSSPPVDEHTRLEARAYASWMKGNLALEQEQWKVACAEYLTALTTCELIAAIYSDDGNLELFDFFTMRAQDVIAPLLRYCQYELLERGITPTEVTSPNDQLQSQIISKKSTTLESEATSESLMPHIVFRENSIAVETRELKMALLKIQDSRAGWERETSANVNSGSGDGNDSKFMSLLSEYDDAISLANRELKQLAALKAGPAVNAKQFQLVNVVGYCKHQKLMMVMGRNEGMANGILLRGNEEKGRMTLKHLEEVTHLYDALVQDARAVASLPGGGSPEDFDREVATGSAATVEDEFLLEAHANILRLRSLRCYYLARMHASPLVRKYTEALTLLDQADSLAREACEEIGACDGMEGRDELLANLDGAVEGMRGEKCRILAVSYLNAKASSTSGKCLLERLHDYGIPSASAPLSHVPPKLEPMACKPSFFDVALNYVSDYPVEELRQALDKHGGGASRITSKGLLGWFRR